MDTEPLAAPEPAPVNPPPSAPPAVPPAVSDSPMSNSPAPPPAAVTVLQGKRSEREVDLEKQLAAEREARRQDQIRLAEKEDEVMRLRQIQSAPPPANPKVTKRAWLDDLL